MTSKNLIIQAHDIETHDLTSLHGLAHANAIEKIDGLFSHQAFRLTDVDAASMDSVKAYCEKAKLDFAFVDSHQDVRRALAFQEHRALRGTGSARHGPAFQCASGRANAVVNRIAAAALRGHGLNRVADPRWPGAEPTNLLR